MRTLLAALLLAAAAQAAEPLLLKKDIESTLHTFEEPILAGDAGGGVVGWFGAGVAFWYPKLDGDMATDGGDRVDFDELGAEDNEPTFVGAAAISLGPLGIRIDGFTTEFSGSSVLTRDIDFGGITFTVGTSVASRVEINNLRLLFTTYIVKTGVLSIALQGGITYFQLEGEMQALGFGFGTENVDVPIPVFGALVQVKVSNVMFEVDVTGLSIEYGSIEGDVLDAQASVGLSFLKVAWVRAGYRYLLVSGRGSGIDFDATMDGFFFAAGVRF